MIISEAFYRRIRDRACGSTNKERLENIVDEITDLVKINAGILIKFVEILREKLNRKDLADKIMSKLRYNIMSCFFLICLHLDSTEISPVAVAVKTNNQNFHILTY